MGKPWLAHLCLNHLSHHYGEIPWLLMCCVFSAIPVPFFQESSLDHTSIIVQIFPYPTCSVKKYVSFFKRTEILGLQELFPLCSTGIHLWPDASEILLPFLK